MGCFEDYPGLVGTSVQLLENRLGATPQGFESLSLHQINIIRTFIQSEMGSDLLYISRKLQIGKRKNGRTAEYGNPPICFM